MGTKHNLPHGRNSRWAVGIFAILCISASLLVPQSAFAAWSSDPDVNTAVCVYTGTQCRPQVVNDGAGGFIVTWRDSTNNGIYAQRYNGDGDALWGAFGSTVTSEYASQNEATPDGEGGVIVSWYDGSDIYAQRLDADGDPMWTIDGVMVIEDDEDAWIAADGEGGAIIMTYYGAVNRIAADGSLPWGEPDDPVVYSPSGDCWAPKIVPDGAGGAILTWVEDSYTAVQRINIDGDLLWGDGTNPLLLSETDDGECPRLVPDGHGGAIVIWMDDSDDWLWAQKIDGAGDIVWTPGGELISTDYVYGDTIDLAYDMNGGAFITWEDGDDDTGYAQYINASGDLVWNDKVQFSAYDDYDDTAQHPRKTVEDGQGGFITGWQNFSEQIMAQRIDANGNILWDAGGTVLSNATSINYGPRLASSGRGGAVAVWVDNRGLGTGQDIYMQGINGAGELGAPKAGGGGTSGGTTVPDDIANSLTTPDSDNDDKILGIECFITAAGQSGALFPLILAALTAGCAIIRKRFTR
ncbi:MAG TPA: hypothetical protein PLT09_08705 [Deltaproteobacteria bacterium]|nr:hypothetical protein [Deltaproteobacteria bacterium]